MFTGTPEELRAHEDKARAIAGRIAALLAEAESEGFDIVVAPGEILLLLGASVSRRGGSWHVN